MRFNPKARLDTSRIRQRGAGRSGGLGTRGTGGLPGGGAALGGGGVVVLVIVIAAFLLLGGGGDPGDSGGADDGVQTGRMDDPDRYAGCETGADANRSVDCARVAVENSLTDFWADELGAQFHPISTLSTFTDRVDTGCGTATSAVGPFYCPVDEGIYLDNRFFDEVLTRQLGGPQGGFVEAYVLAHEYGHHISQLQGNLERVRTQQGPESDAVRLELQADCYAGMWARAATTTEDASGTPLVSDLTDEDVRLALEAASAVGDDRIQQRTQGQVDEETWNHGSSQMRMRWFMAGFDADTVTACDTFSATVL